MVRDELIWNKNQLEKDIAELEHLIHLADGARDPESELAKKLFLQQLIERKELLHSLDFPPFPPRFHEKSSPV